MNSELDKDFIEKIYKNYPKNASKIIDAYQFAFDAHKGVTRKSGEPYIVHPVEVAKILIGINMDYATIMAGLLHDVVEDTSYSLDDIKSRFGDVVAKLVDGVTKIDNLKYSYSTESDSIRRLLVAMGSDIRVIFIKLADRLHNMRTIEFLKRDRQLAISSETRDLFVPIAERIGVRSIRSELQILTFKILHPDEYKKIKDEFDARFEFHKPEIEKVEKTLNKILKDNGINGYVVSWPEHYYSIYKKHLAKGIGKLYGLILFKIVVPTELDCYKTLGLIHKQFKPIPSQIKDFIAVPKANGYKSLHSVLVAPSNEQTFKVMIRSKSMDTICEYGISSLWKDKDSDVLYDEKYEKYNKLKEIVLAENSDYNTSDTFINAIKNDLNMNSTWVFTPKFKPVCLNAEKPTPIDFAYAIHTRVGNNAIGALVNGKKASLGTELATGDVVEILVSEKNKAPSRNWLFVAKTTLARKRIREYINKNTTPAFVEKGKKMLEKELSKTGHTLGDVLALYDQIQKEFNFLSTNDMFASVGYESITVSQIIGYVLRQSEAEINMKKSPVKIEGSNRFFDVFFPKCCCAIPGDEIVGVITRDRVSVHTKECPNLKKTQGAELVLAEWKDDVDGLFQVNLKVIAKDSVGCGAKLLTAISENKFNVTKVEAKIVGTVNCEFELCLLVKNTKELNELIKIIKNVDGVKLVTRDFE